MTLTWRKGRSPIPRFLFRHDQTHAAAVDAPENPMHGFEVEYRATAGEVLQTLRDGGLGWDSSIATYTTIRQAVIPESELKVYDKFVPMFEKRAALRGTVNSVSTVPPDNPLLVEPSASPVKGDGEDEWDEAAWEINSLHFARNLQQGT